MEILTDAEIDKYLDRKISITLVGIHEIELPKETLPKYAGSINVYAYLDDEVCIFSWGDIWQCFYSESPTHVCKLTCVKDGEGVKYILAFPYTDTLFSSMTLSTPIRISKAELITLLL